MKLAAYLLLADGAWLEPSVLSYYDAVDVIVASYDEAGIGWSGLPIPTDECVRRLKAIDRAGKVVWLPGDHRVPAGNYYADGETSQRQAALDVAGDGADFVLQIDGDEILPDLDAFLDRLAEAHRRGAGGLEYAGRTLFSRISRCWYLENSAGYLPRTEPGIPGPVAVRAGARLRFCRQIDAPVARCSWRGSDSTLTPIHKSQALVHAALLRTPAAMHWKRTTSGHAQEAWWDPLLEHWEAAAGHPVRGLLRSMYRRGYTHLRPAYITFPLDDRFEASGVEAWDR